MPADPESPKTPNGGVRSVIYRGGPDGRGHAEVVEFDADGRVVARTYVMDGPVAVEVEFAAPPIESEWEPLS